MCALATNGVDGIVVLGRHKLLRFAGAGDTRSLLGPQAIACANGIGIESGTSRDPAWPIAAIAKSQRGSSIALAWLHKHRPGHTAIPDIHGHHIATAHTKISRG